MKILVSYDGSEGAKEALKYALEMEKKENKKIKESQKSKQAIMP